MKKKKKLPELPKLSKERIEEVFKKIYKGTESMIKKQTWVEDGIEYSSWKIGDGGRGTMYTNDAGAEMVEKAMRQLFINEGLIPNEDGEKSTGS